MGTTRRGYRKNAILIARNLGPADILQNTTAAG